MHHTAFLKPASVTSATRRSPPCQQPSCKRLISQCFSLMISVHRKRTNHSLTSILTGFLSFVIDETKNQEYKWREEAFRKGFPCLPTT
ncbi:uncharacterized protein [Aegilops tauschii subsp. strangulata]|uniref:uncharacterized protein isoform X3 n=1 Tax=Aegilops tauschii subsp. strangulata TaxID=200361 RepID=UPI001ABCCAEC|nr:uncharacterized protein LOC109775947 isoform X6 [Aegilops tauschii subsp. strangulata]XP_044374264.1 uncharacterized protein LOC123096559 isoform X5 [Triticum aestivum]